MHKLEKTLIDNWSKYKPGSRTPEKLEFLMSHKTNKIRLGVFANGVDGALLFIKTTRSSKDNRIIVSEYESLCLAEEAFGGKIPGIIPAIHDCVDIDGRKFLVADFINGGKLEPSLDGFPVHLELACDRLIDIGIASRKKVAEGKCLADLVQNELNTYQSGRPEHGSGETGATIRQLIDAERMGQTLDLAVLQHGDFGLNNLLVLDDGSICVTDWEFSTRYGLPLYDLLFFVIHYFFYYLREPSKSFADEKDCSGVLSFCFGSRSSVRPIISNAISRYCQEMNIEKSIVPAMLLYILIKIENYCRQGLWGEVEQGEWMKMAEALIKKWDEVCGYVG